MGGGRHMEEIRFTRHAIQHMIDRSITVADVSNVLLHHRVERAGRHPSGDTVVLVGVGLKGRPLSVVVAADDPGLVVTAFWTAE